jgi:SAM-dependent methyltransferase
MDTRDVGRTDTVFDRSLPPWARALSDVHWTPVRVARQAARFLAARPGARVLDVGSGVGKFCLIGALTTNGAFTGVEQRLHLVRVARDMARRNHVPRCRFVHGDATALDWSEYDGFYFYNPFAEQIVARVRQSGELDYGPELYERYVSLVEDALARLAPGTRVATYHGFGGEMPDGWRRIPGSGHRAMHLELWEREPELRTTD